MKHFRKCTVILLIILMLSSITAFSYTPPSGYEEVYAEGFEQYATNTQPEGIEIIGPEANRVVVCGENKKALLVDLKADSSELTIPVEGVGNKFFISVNMKVTGNLNEFMLGFADNTGTSYYPVFIESDKIIRTLDGKTVTGTGNNFVELTVGFDLDRQYYTVYRNGKIKIDKWGINSRLKNPARIKIITGADENGGELLLDYIRVYNGNIYNSNKIAVKYNFDEIDYVPSTETIDVNKIIYKNTFDDVGTELSGLAINAKTSKIAVATDERYKNNYMEILKDPSGDAYFEYTNSETLKNMVISADVRTDAGTKGNLWYIRDKNSGPEPIIETYVNINGYDLSGKGGNITTLKPGEFTNIAVVLHFNKNEVDYYVDGELLRRGATLSSSRLRKVDIVRFYIASAGTGDLKIDNLFVYGGEEPRDISKETTNVKSIFQEENKTIASLSGVSVLNPYTGNMFAGNSKSAIDSEAMVENNLAYVTADVFSKLAGVSVRVEGNTVSTADKNINVKILKTDDKTFIPLEECIEGLTVLNCYNDNHGCYFISNKTITGTENWLAQANMFVTNMRYSAEELKNMFFKEDGSYAQHPRIIADKDDFKRIKSERKTNPIVKYAYETIKTKVEGYMDSPIAEYKLDNNKLLGMSVQTKERMLELGLLWHVEGDEKYAKRAIAELEAICNFADWHTSHYLDTGEMTAAAGIGYDWFYDYMSDEQKSMVETAIMNLGIKPTNATYYTGGHWWNTSRLNWNIVCNGGTLVGALAIAETDPDYIFNFIYQNLRSQEYLWYYTVEGGWDESVHYWDYVIEYMSYMMSSIENCLGNDLGYMSYKGIRDFAYYSAYLTSWQGLYNFNDGGETFLNSPFMLYMANYFNDSAIANARFKLMEMGGFKPEVLDVLWYKGDGKILDIDLPKHKYYGDIIQVFAARDSWTDKEGAYAAIQGGQPVQSHDHWDAGTFIYDVLGERWAKDLGWENYATAGASSAKYRMRTEGHNTLLFNPDSGPGQDSGLSLIEKYESDDKSAYAIVDLTSSYETWVSSAKRGMMMTDYKRSLIIRDEFTLKKPAEVYWFMHTDADVRPVDDKTVYLIKNGKAVKLAFESSSSAQLSVMEAESLPTSPQLSQTGNKGTKKVVIKMSASGSVNLTVKLSPMFENAENSPMLTIPLSEWKLTPGAEKSMEREAAYPVMLYADGKPIDGFDPAVGSYKVEYVAENPAPVFTADAQEYTVSVDYTEDYRNGTTLITVSDPAGIKKTVMYCINYKYIAPLEDVKGYERHRFYSFTASETPQEINPPDAAYDGDLDSRWSSETDGAWAIADLGSEQRIDAVGIACWMGNIRKYYFDILVSSDGENWTAVIDRHETSGLTEDYEIVEIQSTTARYVKFVGHLNSGSSWNNVNELAILKRK